MSAGKQISATWECGNVPGIVGTLTMAVVKGSPGDANRVIAIHQVHTALPSVIHATLE